MSTVKDENSANMNEAVKIQPKQGSAKNNTNNQNNNRQNSNKSNKKNKKNNFNKQNVKNFQENKIVQQEQSTMVPKAEEEPRNFYQNQQSNHHANINGNSSMEHRTYKVILGQPTLELPQNTSSETKKFTGRCRIFVANLPNSITEEALKKLFQEYGEVSEVYLGKGNFAFVKMDTRKNAETAKASLDCKTYEGRILRVRLAAHAAALRVKNLPSSVTNELLEYAFSYFGEVERAIVITDDRGRSIGEGIVEFARKFSAQNALKRCTNECFLITALPKPVYVEPFEQRDEEEGFPEKQVNKNNAEFRHEREIGPRFAEPGSFEYEYSVRWKKLYELEKQKRETLELEINEARKLLQEQLEYSRMEHQTKILREQLREMEERADKFGQMRNTRLDDERRREEERQKQMLYLRQQEEDIIRRSQVQDFSNLRRQETDLRSKANALQDLLDKQEQAIRQVSNPVLVNNDQQVYQNRIGFNEGVVQQPQIIPQQPVYNNNMQMIPNNGMNNGMDFNRYPPAPNAINPQQAGPFAGQNSMPINLNVPYSATRASGNGQQNNSNHRFNNANMNNNNGNNRGYQSGGQNKRMRRF